MFSASKTADLIYVRTRKILK